jgi:hypothetical protein
VDSWRAAATLSSSIGASRPAASRASAAFISAASGRPDRRPMASRSWSPSDWLSSHSIARSCSLGPAPPTGPYRPRLPSRGSPFGDRLSQRRFASIAASMSISIASAPSIAAGVTKARSSADVWYSS